MVLFYRQSFENSTTVNHDSTVHSSRYCPLTRARGYGDHDVHLKKFEIDIRREFEPNIKKAHLMCGP